MVKQIIFTHLTGIWFSHQATQFKKPRCIFTTYTVIGLVSTDRSLSFYHHQLI